MMRCDEMSEFLIEYAEGDLDAGREAQVRAHLAECGSCAAELRALERTRALLADDGYVEPSSFFWTRFDSRLRSRLSRGSWIASDDRWARLVPRLAPVVVAAAFFVVGLVVGLRPTAPGGSSGGPPAVTGEGQYAQGPVISPRTKLLVETGGTPERPSEFAADTLGTTTLDPFEKLPGVVLTGAEGHGRVRRLLGEQLLGD
jgi:anti-sigma factor RsiW